MIWDANQAVRTATILPEPQNVNCLAFSPDGRTLASEGRPRRDYPVDMVTGRSRSIATDHEVRSAGFLARWIAFDFGPYGRVDRDLGRRHGHGSFGHFPAMPTSSWAWPSRPTAARLLRRARTGPCESGISSPARSCFA